MRARRSALDLDSTVLAIQGPPVAGKTYTGARMIMTLLAAGKRVGITATSHKVIGNSCEPSSTAATRKASTSTPSSAATRRHRGRRRVRAAK
jgi:hypothetical protein